MNHRILLLSLGLAVSMSGCRASLGFEWATPSSLLRAPGTKPPSKSPAVYRLRELRLLLVGDPGSGKHFTQTQWHEVVEILTDKGLEEADVKIEYGSAKLLAFAARSIDPDGTVHELPSSSAHDEENEVDGKTIRARVFAFPNARVGSVLEYQYTLEHSHLITSDSSYVLASLPTEKYRIEIQGNQSLRVEAKLYNHDTPWSVTQLEGRNGGFRYVWEDTNLPARRTEDFGPDRTKIEPWWAYRITHMIGRLGDAYEWSTSWETTLDNLAAALDVDLDKYEADFHSPVDSSGCTDARCKIERAMAFVSDRIVLDGFGSPYGRPAQKVVDSGRATAQEKARLLQLMLRRADVPARFALANRRFTTDRDDQLPREAVFNHLLLEVELEGSKVWIDPSCGYCQLGEVPPWSQGIAAMVVHGQRGANQRARCEVRDETVKGRAPVRDANRTQYRVRLDDQGGAEIELSSERVGRYAERLKTDTYSWAAKDWSEDFERSASRWSKSYELGRVNPYAWDEENKKAERRADFRVQNFVLKEGSRWLVPLESFDDGWDRNFKSKKRSTELTFTYGNHFFESIELELPPGFRATSLPETQHFEGAFGRVNLQVRQEGQRVTLSRELQFTAGVHAVSEYTKLKRAFDAWRGFRKALIVLEPASPP